MAAVPRPQTPDPPPRAVPADQLFTTPFVLTCLVAVTFFVSHQAIQAALPLYVLRRGGSGADAGTLAMVYSAASLVGRLPIGWAMDRWGRRAVMIAGSGIAVACALLYPAVGSLRVLFGLRAVNGIAMALFSTAAAVVVVDVTPLSRRGEGMGYFGMGSSVGLALGPVLALAVVGWMAFLPLFAGAAAVAFIGVVLGLAVREKVAPSPSPFSLRLETMFTRSAVVPAVLMATLTVNHGALVTLLPLMGLERAVGNPGVFFTAAAVMLVAVRAKAGALSDRWGRAPIIVPGLLLAALAMGLVGIAHGQLLLLAAGVLYGLAFGMAQPALMALVADRAGEAERGRAISTFYAGWESGIGVGAYLLGHLLTWTGFTIVFWTGALVVAGGGVSSVFLYGRSGHRSGAPIP